MKVTSVQPTPNPNAFKFVTDQLTVADGTLSFSDASQASDHPLARALFEIDGVDTLFFCEDFVTVSMTPDAEWRSVHEAVVRTLDGHEGHSPSARPAAASVASAPAPTSTAPAAGAVDGDPELLQQINDLLDDRVRPALAGDGGGLEILGLDGKTLKIRYQGACGSCPSSIAGTLHAIQNLLQTEVDQELEVVPA